MASPTSERSRAKSRRTEAILTEAASLFAAHGYHGVSLEDIGTAVGISGPGLYRHFNGKQALLGAVLLQASERLVEGGKEQQELHTDPEKRMEALIQFHVAFAQRSSAVIRVQDRDLHYLTPDDQERVRGLQRDYVALWMDTLGKLIDGTPHTLRLRVQACFGLINSTPHSTDTASRASEETARLLAAMAKAALTAKHI